LKEKGREDEKNSFHDSILTIFMAIYYTAFLAIKNPTIVPGGNGLAGFLLSMRLSPLCCLFFDITLGIPFESFLARGAAKIIVLSFVLGLRARLLFLYFHAAYDVYIHNCPP
jgi:hypothetical protein